MENYRDVISGEGLSPRAESFIKKRLALLDEEDRRVAEEDFSIYGLSEVDRKGLLLIALGNETFKAMAAPDVLTTIALGCGAVELDEVEDEDLAKTARRMINHGSRCRIGVHALPGGTFLIDWGRDSFGAA